MNNSFIFSRTVMYKQQPTTRTTRTNRGRKTDLVEDDELGSVGNEILGVEEAFSDTGDLRRGVVYCASALVLVMSAIYVVVGYYALRKDDGRGKAGGASMRG